MPPPTLELEPEETPGASQALQHGSTISRHEPSPQDSAHVLHRSFSLLNEAILFRVSRLNEAIPFRALPHRRRLLARASPLLNASAAMADCFSPQEAASLLCAPTWLRYPHATHSIFQFPSIILLGGRQLLPLLLVHQTELSPTVYDKKRFNYPDVALR